MRKVIWVYDGATFRPEVKLHSRCARIEWVNSRSLIDERWAHRDRRNWRENGGSVLTDVDICIETVRCRLWRRSLRGATDLLGIADGKYGTLRHHGIRRRWELLPYVLVSFCNAPTFESIDLENSFLLSRYIFRICRSRWFIKVQVKVTWAKKSVSCLRMVCFRLKGNLIMRIGVGIGLKVRTSASRGVGIF